MDCIIQVETNDNVLVCMVLGVCDSEYVCTAYRYMILDSSVVIQHIDIQYMYYDSMYIIMVYYLNVFEIYLNMLIIIN